MCLVEIMMVKPESKKALGQHQSINASEYWCVGEENAEDVGKRQNARGKSGVICRLQGGTEEFPVANHSKVNYCNLYKQFI